MKKTFLFLLPLAILFTIASCTKEGADGKDGNANVIVITSGADTLTATDASIDVLLPASVSPGTIDSSLVLVYYKGNPNQSCNYWYQSPGLGCKEGKKQISLSKTLKTQHFNTKTGPSEEFASAYPIWYACIPGLVCRHT